MKSLIGLEMEKLEFLCLGLEEVFPWEYWTSIWLILVAGGLAMLVVLRQVPTIARERTWSSMRTSGAGAHDLFAC